MATLATVPLLIIDDLGMRKLPLTAAEDLLEVIMRRHERAATLLTSNRPVEDWGEAARRHAGDHRHARSSPAPRPRPQVWPAQLAHPPRRLAPGGDTELTTTRPERPSLWPLFNRRRLAAFETSTEGFAGSWRRRSARIGTAALRRYALAVSRRTPISASMRRSGHPSRPSAITCCRFASLKTLAIPDGDSLRRRRRQRLARSLTTGRFSGVHQCPRF
jgi:hypothetical protein